MRFAEGQWCGLTAPKEGEQIFQKRICFFGRGTPACALAQECEGRGPAQVQDPKTCKPDLVTYTPIAVRRLEKFPLSANASTNLGPQNAGDNHTPINCLASAPSLK